jgi:hypothetical protein
MPREFSSSGTCPPLARINSDEAEQRLQKIAPASGELHAFVVGVERSGRKKISMEAL